MYTQLNVGKHIGRQVRPKQDQTELVFIFINALGTTIINYDITIVLTRKLPKAEIAHLVSLYDCLMGLD